MRGHYILFEQQKWR